MFDRERHPVDVTHKGQSYRFYARELGYIHFQELSRAKYPDPRDIHLMSAVVVASVEKEDGKPAFTFQTWRDAPQVVVEVVLSAAMKAQGLEYSKEEPPPEGKD